ncbi:phage tail tape measure protein [Paenibacillus azoreducens]|uniref:phage tail tape measure protein n=1 Tax=Paenibacillus azoreducens TaxID=116718 RepID=UPI0039F56418
MGKQYEIMFKLDAATDSSFSKAFNSASSDFKRLYDLARNLERGPSNSTLTKAVRDDLRRTQATNSTVTKSMRDDMRRMQQEMRNTGSTASKMSTMVRRGLLSMTAGFSAGALAVSSFKKAADFEEQLSSIQALTGLSSGEMKRVHDLALELGAKTKYSALEAAQGMEELLKAGMSTEQVVGGGLEASLNLAAAGSLGLADAAEIMSTAMNAFKSDGMAASQAADILAGAANASATSVEELRYSLAAASAVASGVGLSFKDTNVALGLFANNGLKGSDAGTSLKTMLSRLTPMTSEQYAQFMDLGLMTFKTTEALNFLNEKGVKPVSNNMQDVINAMTTYSAKTANAKVGSDKANKAFRVMASEAGALSSDFYDANGNLKSMADIAGILQNALKDMNAEQRQVALYKIFGSDAIRGANILFKEGAEGVKKFDEEMSKVTALEVATKRMDNAKGAVEQFRGAMETLQISVLEPTMPLIKELALSAAEASEKFQAWMNTRQAKVWGNTLLGVLKAAPKLIAGTAAAWGAMKIGKGAVNTVEFFKGMKGISTATSSAAAGMRTAATATRLFGAASFMLTNPIGLAITGIGLLTTGVLAYKKRQEEARQALIHMKDTLDTAYSNYTAADEQSRKTGELIKEYDRLTGKIKDAKTPAKELEEARRKLKEVEQELIDMNPDILSAEDAKTGKLREQAGYVKQIKDAQKESAKLDLEKTIFDGMANLPKMEENLRKLRDDAPNYQEKMNQVRKDYAAYEEFNTRLRSIMQNRSLSLSERNEQRTAVFDDIQKYRGKDDLRGRDADLSYRLKELQDAYSNNLDLLRKTNAELTESENSYKALYDQAKHYIEMESGLEGTLEEQAKKYKSMSEEQKKKFDEELAKIDELNSKLNMLPKNMQIDLDVVYREIGKPQSVKRYSANSTFKNYAEYAEGGMITRPHVGLVGEAGPEMIVPLSPGKRGRGLALWERAGSMLGVRPYAEGGLVGGLEVTPRSGDMLEKANRIMGHSGSGNEINVTFAPQITVQGGGSNVKQEVAQALKQAQSEFERRFQAMMRQQGRVTMQ